MNENNWEIPPWMQNPEPVSPVKSRKVRHHFLEKTLGDINTFFHARLLTEQIASRRGLCQQIDGRVKSVTFFFLLLMIGFLQDPLHLLLAYGIVLGLAAASRIKLFVFIKQTWLTVLLFTGLIVLPAIFSFVTPGDPVLSLGPKALTVTAQGLTGAGILLLRAVNSISLVTLLILTTPWNHLLRGLRSLGTGKIFVMVLEMTLRYIMVLLTVVHDMLLARKSRQIAEITGRQGREFVGGSFGSLWGKSRWMADEVYLAMLSRGYQGEPKFFGEEKLSAIDFVWSTITLSIIMTFFYFDRFY